MYGPQYAREIRCLREKSTGVTKNVIEGIREKSFMQMLVSEGEEGILVKMFVQGNPSHLEFP